MIDATGTSYADDVQWARVAVLWSISMKQFLGFLFAFVLVLSFGRSVSTQTMGTPEQFSAGAIDMNNGRAGQIQINVDRWSTAADRANLVEALFSKGSDQLLKVIQDTKSVGRIRTPDSIGYDLRYSQQRPGRDGGRDIVLVTDRPISFWEAVNRPRSVDYPFTLIQIHANPDGTGEGKLAVATKITADPDTKMIEIEDFQHQPVRLVDVKSEKKH
jgi:hypothetical protein